MPNGEEEALQRALELTRGPSPGSDLRSLKKLPSQLLRAGNDWHSRGTVVAKLRKMCRCLQCLQVEEDCAIALVCAMCLPYRFNAVMLPAYYLVVSESTAWAEPPASSG